MFYVISKIFWVVAQPISAAALLVLAGIVLAGMGKRRSGMASSLAGLGVLVLTSFTTFGFLITQPLEARFVRPAVMPEQVGAIIVLGGSTLARVSAARGIAELNDAGDRLTDAVVLARRYPEARLVYSGGMGLLDANGEPEAKTAERFFLSMGISRDRLVLEDQSRNTDENAELTAALIGDVTGDVLLVTSAFHMPRSVGLFRRVGIEATAWPTDYRSSGLEGFGLDFSNPVNTVSTTSIAIKEWIGLLVYSWTGRIDTLLPAQTSN